MFLLHDKQHQVSIKGLKIEDAQLITLTYVKYGVRIHFLENFMVFIKFIKKKKGIIT